MIKQIEKSPQDGEATYLVDDGDLDLDEEMALYEELDDLMDVMEARWKNSDVKWEKVAAHSFIESALKINQVESTWQLFVEVFAASDVVNAIDPQVTMEGLAWGLVAYKAQTSDIDIEGIFEEVYNEWKEETEEIAGYTEPFCSATSTLPLSYIFSNNSKIRRAFLEMDINANLCSIMSSHLGVIFIEAQAFRLLDGCKKINAEDGQVLWDPEISMGCLMLVIRGGVRLQNAQGTSQQENPLRVGNARVMRTAPMQQNPLPTAVKTLTKIIRKRLQVKTMCPLRCPWRNCKTT